jgi:hypothetical protein
MLFTSLWGFRHAAIVAVDHPRRNSCAQRHSDIQNSRSCRAKQMVDNPVLIPFVNIIALWIFAHARWPALDRMMRGDRAAE